MIINHQAHWYPSEYLDSIVGRSSYPRTERLDGGRYVYETSDAPGAWKFTIDSHFSHIEEQIASMDAAGVGMAVLNTNMVGEVDRLPLPEARDTIAMLNEELAAVQRRYPDRIAGLAMLPMQDADAAIEALDRAVDLDLRGVFIPSNIAGRPIALEESLPIYERINHHRLPIYLHPTSNSMLYDRDLGFILDTTMGWMYDSSVAAMQLILNGVLDANPHIEVVHLHMGGVIPYVWGRSQKYVPKYLDLEHSVDHYLRNRFYVDIQSETPGALDLAVATYGEDRLLYGDDYPWHPHRSTLDRIEKDFDPALAQKILHENRVSSLRLTPKTDRTEP